MSTASLPAFKTVIGDPAVTEMDFAAPTVTGNVMVIADLPLFRTGTFVDAYGEEATFDDFMLEMMVMNFDYLKSNKIYENVPARLGHRKSPVFSDTDPLKDLVGYVDSVRTEKRKSPIVGDDNEYLYLLANVSILDANAQTHINNGLWRERSAEIGYFVDNNGVTYSPCILGYAYVDLGAVRGLNFASEDKDVKYFTTEEIMGEVIKPPTPGSNTGEQFKFTIGQSETFDPQRVQQYITNIENQFASVTAERDKEKQRADELQAFKEATEAEERSDFVSSLIKENKILASKKDDTVKLVNSFSAEQFESWKSMYDGAPANSVLTGGGKGDNPTLDTANQQQQYAAGDEDAAAKQARADKNVIRSLKMAGKSDDAIKATQQFARLSAADKNFTLASITEYTF